MRDTFNEKFYNIRELVWYSIATCRAIRYLITVWFPVQVRAGPPQTVDLRQLDIEKGGRQLDPAANGQAGYIDTIERFLNGFVILQGFIMEP
jgi:hypothetical protein